MNWLNKLIHPPEYPARLPSKKGKLAYFYQWHMYVMDMGRGQVFGKVTQLFGEATLLVLALDKVGYVNLTIMQILLFSMLSVIVVWFGGWVYIMLKMDIVRVILNRERDVVIKDIYDMIKKNEDKKQ